ncbi:RNA polymerase sigma-70 factor (ECF subfamily) [Pedobacter cryoconitis]|uniref:RNA polymerase sigma-70 factor (ECF subfamily) n=1 Tax=Pedobacter cryoconitis TaxID=188932 RepID=A0A7W8YS32_9SPHI|nr:sigma-70 family RNA polymerase sigma factor [Pedobacter cryoconitis]MBB5620791.1 RNA polymerase sigma-70 factor (ECF subfamily) [Pedobacter cryoconitis]MBB5646010.1 RNA polymerase sigma-70 factor (ECF subfamily) [Pedobacter cryoconitis]
MKKSSLSDQGLWAEVTAGDSSAFVILYNRHWSKLYQTACFYLKDKSLAEEIVHDIYVVLWDRRAFLKIENFKSYIHVTARYHVFKKLKAAKICPIDYVETYTENTSGIIISETTEKLLQEDFETELKAYLENLPKRCAEIFLLSRVENLSNSEIAKLLGISKFTVENQITHALKYIRTRINLKSA